MVRGRRWVVFLGVALGAGLGAVAGFFLLRWLTGKGEMTRPSVRQVLKLLGAAWGFLQRFSELARPR